FVLNSIDDIIFVRDGKYFLSIEPDLDEGLVLLWKPETIDFLILPRKIGPLNPERQFLGGISLDPTHGVVVCDNPQFAFKQVFISPLGNCLRDETMVRTYLLLTEDVQGIVRRGDRTIVTLLAAGRFDLARDQWIQGHLAHQSRPRLRRNDEGF